MNDQLAKELQKHGIKIACRTVAQYRKLMSFPPGPKTKIVLTYR